jgi:hypothetical protein
VYEKVVGSEVLTAPVMKSFVNSDSDCRLLDALPCFAYFSTLMTEVTSSAEASV